MTNKAKSSKAQDDAEMSAEEVSVVYDKEAKYSIKDWLIKSMRNYANFNGRARRREYLWLYVIALLLVGVGLSIDVAVSVKTEYLTYGVIGLFIAALFVIPLFAAGSRRLHDIGRSGWWQLLWVLPIAVSGIALVWVDLYASKLGVIPITLVSDEAIAVMLTIIISSWIAISTLLTINTSDKKNKYGLPAKRTGKKLAVETKDKNTMASVVTKKSSK